MYKITNATKRAAVRAAYAGRTRHIINRITFGHYVTTLGIRSFVSDKVVITDGLQSLSVTQVLNGDEDATVGSVGSSSYSATFNNPSSTFNYLDKIAFVESGVLLADGTYYYTPCGYFATEKPETDDDGKTLTVTGYDEIDKMGGKWTPSITVTDTTTLKDVVENIASMHGLSVTYVDTAAQTALKNHVIGVATAAELTEQSERDVLGYCVGCAGMSARVNTVGKLYISWFFSPGSTYDYTVTADVQWENGFKKSAESAVKIEAVSAGEDEDVYTKGTGVPLSFANPLVTHAEIDAIYTRYNGRTWYPSTCTWRGDPCIEVGDIITVKDKNSKTYTVYVAQQELDLSGGLQSTITSPNLDTTEMSFDSVSASVKLELSKVQNSMEAAIKAATDAINGANGGYYRILDLDKDGNPDGWECFATNGLQGVKCTYGGIGCTTDGGKTYTNAMTGAGINATAITTGIITGGTNGFSFNLESGHIEASDINITGGNINIKGKGRRTYYLWLDKENASKYGFKSAKDYAAEDAHKAYIDADWVTPESYPQTEPYYIQVSGWANCKLDDSFRITGAIYNRSYNVSTLDVAVIIAVDVVDAQGNKSTVNLYSAAVPFSSNGDTIIDTTVKVNAQTLGSASLTPTAYSVRIGTFTHNTRTLKNVTAGWYAVYNLVVGRTTTTDGGSLLVTGSDGYTADLSSGVLKLSYKSGDETQQFFNMANTRIYSDSDTYKWYSTLATGNSTLLGHQRGGFKFGTSTEDAKEYVWMDTTSTDPHADLRQNWFSTFALLEADAMTIRKQVVTNPYGFDVFAGLLHHKYVGGKEHTVGLGIGTISNQATGAIELRNESGIAARLDVYSESTNNICLRLYQKDYSATLKIQGGKLFLNNKEIAFA